MKDYKYTPFNVLGSIIFVSSLLVNIRLYKDFSFFYLIYPLIGLLFIAVDYYFQKKKYNFRKLFVVESIISLFLVSYYIFGLINNF